MDEIRIWDRALSQQEIIDGMYTQIELAPNLMGRWALDDLEDTVFTDSTGNEHYGGVHGVTVELSDLAPIGQAFCDYSEPSDVAGLYWLGYPDQRLIWENQPGMAFDIAGGLLSELRLHGGTTEAQCLSDDYALYYFSDERPDPPPGEGYYFLIRSVGACETSSYGKASPDDDRIILNDCP
jgi:hypothetical protein